MYLYTSIRVNQLEPIHDDKLVFKSLFKFSIILLTILTGEDDRGWTKQKTGLCNRKSLDREEKLEFLHSYRHNSLWIYFAHAWSVLNAVQRNIEFHSGKYIHIFWKGLHPPICLPQKGSGILASAKYLREQASGAPPTVSRDYQVSCYPIIFTT